MATLGKEKKATEERKPESMEVESAGLAVHSDGKPAEQSVPTEAVASYESTTEEARREESRSSFSALVTATCSGR